MNKNEKDYEVIMVANTGDANACVEDLENRVSALLKNNYAPVGGLSFFVMDDNTFIATQAMMRKFDMM